MNEDAEDETPMTISVSLLSGFMVYSTRKHVELCKTDRYDYCWIPSKFSVNIVRGTITIRLLWSFKRHLYSMEVDLFGQNMNQTLKGTNIPSGSRTSQKGL